MLLYNLFYYLYNVFSRLGFVRKSNPFISLKSKLFMIVVFENWYVTSYQTDDGMSLSERYYNLLCCTEIIKQSEGFQSRYLYQACAALV